MALEGLEGVQCVADDVIIYGKDHDDHNRNLIPDACKAIQCTPDILRMQVCYHDGYSCEIRYRAWQMKCIDAYGRKGVSPAPQIFGTSDGKMMTPTVFLGPKHNFYSLTVCRLNQYLPNGSEKTGFLS